MKNLFLSILAIATLTLVSCGGTETKKTASEAAAPAAPQHQLYKHQLQKLFRMHQLCHLTKGFTILE